MLKKQDPKLVFRIIFFLLVANGVRGTGFWRYRQPYQTYINFRFTDRTYPAYENSEDYEESPVQTASRSFVEEPTVKRLPLQRQGPRMGNAVEPEDKFLFPDSARLRAPEVGPVPKCKGLTFCEEVPDYPTDVINDAIMKNKALQNYENVDVIDSISQRVDVSDTEALCRAKERVIYPKSAETIDKEWLFVLNHQNFTQGVRIELCEEEGQACKLFDGFAEGYVTSCKQKYIYRELTAVVADGTIGHEFFRFPASCCCSTKFTGTISRLGLFDRQTVRRVNRAT